MTDKKFISFLKKLVKNNFEQTDINLRNAGFKVYGRGCFKKVYINEKRKDLVVKVYYDDDYIITSSGFNSWKEDSRRRLPKKLSKYWLKPIARFKRCIVQYKVERRRKAYDVLYNMYNVRIHRYDIHECNCGFLNKKPVFFDYI